MENKRENENLLYAGDDSDDKVLETYSIRWYQVFC